MFCVYTTFLQHALVIHECCIKIFALVFLNRISFALLCVSIERRTNWLCFIGKSYQDLIPMSIKVHFECP